VGELLSVLQEDFVGQVFELLFDGFFLLSHALLLVLRGTFHWNGMLALGLFVLVAVPLCGDFSKCLAAPLLQLLVSHYKCQL
jgi:hypothetical protein